MNGFTKSFFHRFYEWWQSPTSIVKESRYSEHVIQVGSHSTQESQGHINHWQAVTLQQWGRTLISISLWNVQKYFCLQRGAIGLTLRFCFFLFWSQREVWINEMCHPVVNVGPHFCNVTACQWLMWPWRSWVEWEPTWKACLEKRPFFTIDGGLYHHS